jgi:hypothetical protein
MGLDETGIHFKEHLEGVTNKFMSFARTLEPSLSTSLDKMISERRQLAWKNSRRIRKHTPTALITGSSFSFDEKSALLDTGEIMKNTYINEGLSIDLPPARFNVQKRTPLENAYYESHMDEGPVSHYGDELDYETKYQDDGPHLRYYDELDELKHIYKCFWYGARRCKKRWLLALYELEDLNERICDYNIARWRPYSNLEYDDNTVLLEVGFNEIEVSVEELFRWIEEYRVPNKEYAIGACEDHKLVLYSILLVNVHHRDPYLVAEGLKTGVLEEVFSTLGNLLSSTIQLGTTVTEYIDEDNASSLYRRMEEIKVPAKTVTFDDSIMSLSLEDIAEEYEGSDSNSSETVSSNATVEEIPWYVAEQNQEGSVTSSNEDDNDDVPEEDALPPTSHAESYRLRGWFEGHAVETFPESESNPLESHIDDGYDSDNMLPKPISDKDKRDYIIIDPDQWRPMRSTEYRQLEYIWGVKPQRYKTSRKLLQLAARKTFDPGGD